MRLWDDGGQPFFFGSMASAYAALRRNSESTRSFPTAGASRVATLYTSLPGGPRPWRGPTCRAQRPPDRWSALIRQDGAGDRQQVLAANLDLVFVVVPTDRLNLARVERELLIAWESGAATGDVRSSDRRGRHATTARHLVAVPPAAC